MDEDLLKISNHKFEIRPYKQVDFFWAILFILFLAFLITLYLNNRKGGILEALLLIGAIYTIYRLYIRDFLVNFGKQIQIDGNKIKINRRYLKHNSIAHVLLRAVGVDVGCTSYRVELITKKWYKPNILIATNFDDRETGVFIGEKLAEFLGLQFIIPGNWLYEI